MCNFQTPELIISSLKNWWEIHTCSFLRFPTYKESIKSLSWIETLGAAAEDGFTTQILAVKGTVKIDEIIKEFSFMVKLAPNRGFMATVVKEVSMAQ